MEKIITLPVFLLLFLLQEPGFLCASNQLDLSIGGQIVNKLEIPDNSLNSNNWNCVWDKDGVAYIGNDRLWRWDGNNWSVHGPSNLRILKGLTFDDSNNLWVGGFNSLGYFNLESLTYTSIIDQIPEKYRNFGEIWSLNHDGNSLWVTTSNLLFRFSNNNFSCWEFSSGHRVIFHFVNNEIFAHEVGVGIWKIFNNQKILYCNDLRVIKKSIIYFESIGVGKYRAISGEGFFEIQNGIVTHYQNLDFIEDRSFSCALELNDKRILVGTLGSGIYEFNLTSRGVQINAWNEASKDEIILSIKQDQSGVIWSMTLTGIWQHADFKNCRLITSNAISENSILIDANIKNNKLLVSSVTGCYELSNDIFGRLSVEKLSSNQSWKIKPIADGLIYDDYDSLKFFNNQRIRELAEFESNILTFEHVEPGYLHVAFQGKISSYRTGDGDELELLSEQETYAALGQLESDSAGTVWGWSAGTPLYRLEQSGEEDSFRLTEIREINGVDLMDTPRRISVGSSGPVIVTGSSILRWNGAVGDWETGVLETGMGIPDAQVFIETGTGISGHLVYFEPDTACNLIYSVSWEAGAAPGWERVPWVDMRDIGKVIQVNHFSEPQPGLMVVGMKGILMAELGLSEQIPLPRKPVIWDAGNSKPARPDYEMPFREQGTRFLFGSPGNALYYPVRYQTRLSGLQEEWSAPTEFADKEIGQLFEGDYRFEVRAIDPYGRMSPVNSIHLSIQPPWYRSGYAYFVYIIVALLFIAVVIKIRERQLWSR